MISTILSSNEVKCAYTNFYQEINRSECQCIFLCIKWSTKNLSSTGPSLEQSCSGPRLLASGLPKWAQLSSSPGPPWGYSKEGKVSTRKYLFCANLSLRSTPGLPLWPFGWLEKWMGSHFLSQSAPGAECKDTLEGFLL